MPTRKKRQYIHDLIKVAMRDINGSIERNFGARRSAFGNSFSCPIIESLTRHGHNAEFVKFKGKHGSEHVRIDGTLYKASPKMVKWQKGGMSGRRRTLPFSFRISSLETVTE